VSEHAAAHPHTPFTEHGTPAHAAVPVHGEHVHDHAHQFDDAQQQYDATTLAMWAFLATEVLFFGGVFCAYVIYRHEFFEGYRIGSHFLNKWIGFANTGVLLCSSFTAAMGVRASHLGRRKQVGWWLLFTAILGTAFVALKLTFEYRHEWHVGLAPLPASWNPSEWVPKVAEHIHGMNAVDPIVQNHVRIFFIFYFTMTMIHALHMIIGVVIMLIMIVRTWFTDFAIERTNMMEMMGLYWHFVDIVWIFLFPLLYLIR
jgi:cytochrome c oxidase subunit 3